MELDLGNSVIFNVKVNGGEHELKSPTVKQAQEFYKNAKDNDEDAAGLFIAFVIDLGLPKKVAESLDIGQLKKLSEGLMSISEKK